jgi:phage tail-like protein
MALGDRVDPLRGFSFCIEIDNTTGAVAGFREVSGLSSSTAVVEYREGNEQPLHVRKLTGLRTAANLVFKRGITLNVELWQWYRNIVNGIADRRNGAVILRDEEQNDVLRWNFTAGWPTKYDGPTFNATTNEVALETLEIAVESIELV